MTENEFVHKPTIAGMMPPRILTYIYTTDGSHSLCLSDIYVAHSLISFTDLIH